MNRPVLEVADLARAAGDGFIERSRRWIRWKHVKVLLAIARCRTAALGGHLDECTRCGHRAPISYNSCRDRHCPKCQTAARDRWIAARRQELLPTRYLHVVFTLPHRLAPLVLQNKKVLYGLLFRTSAGNLSRQVCRCARAGFSEWPASLRGRSETSRSTQDLCRLVAAAVSTRMGGLLETSLRWPRICAALSGPLHSSRGHLQPSPGRPHRWPSHFSLA